MRQSISDPAIFLCWVREQDRRSIWSSRCRGSVAVIPVFLWDSMWCPNRPRGACFCCLCCLRFGSLATNTAATTTWGSPTRDCQQCSSMQRSGRLGVRRQHEAIPSNQGCGCSGDVSDDGGRCFEAGGGNTGVVSG